MRVEQQLKLSLAFAPLVRVDGADLLAGGENVLRNNAS